MNKKWLRVLALLMALALVASACGDDDDDGDTGAATDDTTEETTAPVDDDADIFEVVKSDPLHGTEGSGLTRGISDDSIKLGCIWDAKSYAGFDEGVKARFHRANEEGGVHGREIDFTGCEDDAADQQQFLSLTKQLVEQDEVFGLVTIEGVIPQAAFDYLNEEEVPYTGWGFLPGFCGQRWGFGWNGCLSGNALEDLVPHAVVQTNLADAVIAAAGLDGADLKVAIQGQDTESTKIAEAQYRAVFENAGAEVVYAGANIPVPGPTTDYTPFVRPLLDADPNLVMVSTSFGDVGGFTAALRAAGFEGTIFNFVAYIPGLLDAVPQLAQALEGAYINTQTVPQETQTAYVKQIEADLEASGASSGNFITFGGALGYAQADLWIGLLEAAGEDLNTETFDQAVNVEGITIAPEADGGVGETMWPQHKFLPTNCAAVVKVEGGKYTVAREFECYEPLRIR